MDLSDWLKSAEISPMQFGRRLASLQQPNSIYRYLRGDRMPEPEVLSEITMRTAGDVRFEDFRRRVMARKNELSGDVPTVSADAKRAGIATV
jgi:hypothetical protein